MIWAMRACLLLLALSTFRAAATPSLQCPSTAACSFKCIKSCDYVSQGARWRLASHISVKDNVEMPPLHADDSAIETEPMPDLIRRVTKVSEQKALANTQVLTPTQYPVATLPNGQWETKAAGHWMSGFFPGIMWQLYELTGRKQLWAEKAQLWQAALANKQREFASQHDFGFIYLPSFAHSYSVTGSPEDKRQALAAAEALSWAFVPATKSLRTFEGWKTPASTDMYQQIVIIDFMINIQMLVWGAKHVGPAQDLRMDMNPAEEWLNMAMHHARQVAKNHVRPDGSTYHIVEYNPNTGSINKRYTYQGHSAESTWARGQAWAMAGFAMLYNATGKQEFRDVAVRLTDKYLERMSAQAGGTTAAAADYDGYVPQWDFDAPWYPDMDGPRDTSAAAVAALGMLYLAEADQQLSIDKLSARTNATGCGQKYLCAAVSTLRALASSHYLAAAEDASFPALLKHATGGFPLRDHVDVGLISGDYYFLAALQKCAGMRACMSM